MTDIQLECQTTLNQGTFRKKSIIPSQSILDENHKERNSKSSKRKLVQKNDTIEVLSDQQENQIIKSIFQEELFRTKIEEAKLTKSKFVILKTLYTEFYIKSPSNEEKNKKFNSISKGFISKHLKTSKGQPFDIRTSHFFDKMTPKPDDKFVQNQYIIFGCDLISNKQIQKMFNKQKPTIKWVDASHCRLSFMQKISGWQAVVQNCLNLQQLQKDLSNNTKVEDLLNNLEIQQQQQEERQKVQSKYNQKYLKQEKFKKQFHLLKDYVQLMPYYEIDFKRRLMIRNATCKQQLIGYNINNTNSTNNNINNNNNTNNNNINNNSNQPNNINTKPNPIISQLPQNDKTKPQQSTKQISEYRRYLIVKQQFLNSLQNNKLVKQKYQQIQQQLQRQYEMIKLKGKYGKKYHINYNNQTYDNQLNYSANGVYKKNKYNKYNNNQGYNNSYNQGYNNYNDNNYSYNKQYKNNDNFNQYNDRNRSRQYNKDQQHPYYRHNNQYYHRQHNNQSFKKNKYLQRKQRKQYNIQKNFEYYIQQRDGVFENNNINQYNNQYNNNYEYNQYQIQQAYQQYANNSKNNKKQQISNKYSNKLTSQQLSNYQYNPKQNKNKNNNKQNQVNFQQYIQQRYQQKVKQNNKINKNEIILQNESNHNNSNILHQNEDSSSFIINDSSFLSSDTNKNNKKKKQLNLQEILNNINSHDMSYTSPMVSTNSKNIRQTQNQDDDLDFILNTHLNEIQQNNHTNNNNMNSLNNNMNNNMNMNNNINNISINSNTQDNNINSNTDINNNNLSKLQTKLQPIQQVDFGHVDFVSHLKMQSQQIYQYQIQRKNALMNQSQIINNQQKKSTKKLIPKKKKNNTSTSQGKNNKNK